MYFSLLIIFILLFSMATAGLIIHPESKMKLIFLYFIFNSIFLTIFTASYFLGVSIGRFYVLVLYIVVMARLLAGTALIQRGENLKNE